MLESFAGLNAGDEGSQGIENPVDPPGALSGRAWAIATPSAAINTKADAKLAYLRTMAR